MRYEAWVGIRYLFGRSKEKFISIISLISVIGVATGVATLIVVIGVMSGFDTELRNRIIGTSSHIVVEKIGGLDQPQGVMDSLKGLEHVMASAPFVNTQALLIDKEKLFALMIRGIDEKLETQVTGIGKFIKHGSLDLSGNNIIIGKELAQRFLVRVGDEVQLVSSPRVKAKAFKIAGIFSSGMYDYDANVAFMRLDKAQALAQNPNIISGISIKVDDVYKAHLIKKDIQAKLGFPYYTRTWMDLNRNLFDALKLEKTAMFIILTLIVLVAALNIGSTLIMMVMEKTKDIGILKAIGATNKSIHIIFTIVGMAIGVIGTVFGAAGGLGLAYILKTYQFIQLPQDIYYIDKLPVRVEGLDVLWIVLAALCISLFATLYPAHHAARLNPGEALRYE